jgi:hypothetical protein
MISNSIKAIGTNHIVTGQLFFAGAPTVSPADGTITFNANITSRPGEVMTESTVGAGYSSGYWYINAGNFPTAWSAGDQLHVTFTCSDGEDATTSFDFILTSDDPDMTPITYIGILVRIKVWLEGPYDPDGDNMTTVLQTGGEIPTTSPYDDSREVSTIPTDITDWVFIELRNAADGEAVDSRSFFLKNNGWVTDDDGTTTDLVLGVPEDDYFIVVVHRNHLAAMSASAQSLNSSGAAVYDFTTASSQFYGGAAGAQEVDTGVWGMIAGDCDGSGTVDALDRSDAWNDRNLTGYQDSDCGLTATVDANDRGITWNNRNLTTSVP